MALAPSRARDAQLATPTGDEVAVRPGAPAAGFIPELESVRGIAVLLVFAFHVDSWIRAPFVVQPTTPLSLAFVRAGHTGVDLFFVLSGFLLSLPFLSERARGKRASIRHYFARRALRILPLYYTAVVVGAAATAHQLVDMQRVLPYLAFLNGFAGMVQSMHPYSGVWWSLATEFHFYLLLPLLPLALRSRAGRWLVIAVFCAYVLTYVAIVRGTLTTGTVAGQRALTFSLFGRAPLFLWGILGAAVYHRFGESLRTALARQRWLRVGGADLAFVALIVANALFLQWLVSIGPVRQMGTDDVAWHIVNGALWAAFILLLLLAPLRTKPLFSNPVLGTLGLLSYSIYLIHGPLFETSLYAIRVAWPRTFHGWHLRTFAVVVVLTAVCLALSALTYRFIERPFLMRKARVAS